MRDLVTDLLGKVQVIKDSRGVNINDCWLVNYD